MKTFFNSLSKNIRQSLIQRQQIQIPSVKRFIYVVLLLLLIYIAAAIIFAPDDYIDFHFTHEAGAITALSAIMLAITSGLAWVTFFLSKKKNLVSYFWLFVSIGFGFFALDELLEFHEKLGHVIKASPVGPSETFRNWNDLIVIVYGIIAVCIAIYFLSEILRYPLLVEILSVAFLGYCVHTMFDLTFGDSSLGRILEESAKVFSSTFFAIATFVGLLGVISANYKRIR